MRFVNTINSQLELKFRFRTFSIGQMYTLALNADTCASLAAAALFYFFNYNFVCFTFYDVLVPRRIIIEYSRMEFIFCSTN